MKEFITPDLMRQALESLRDPRALENHPWQQSQFLQKYRASQTAPVTQTDGMLLALALVDLFRQFMPASPPRRKKRLDTRWGEFGILAAQYIAPFLQSRPAPRSLREAWEQIDPAILLIAFPETDPIPPEQREAYRLVSDEPEPASNSTLSDWHRNGVERFTAFVEERESAVAGEIAPGPSAPHPRSSAKKWKPGRNILILITLLVLSFFAWGGLKAQRLYNITQALQANLREARQISATLNDIDQAGVLLADARANLNALDAEVRPYLWIASQLYWLPDYGGELYYASTLLDFAQALSETAQHGYDASAPLAHLVLSEGGVRSAEVSLQLAASRPDFAAASQSFEQAVRLRQAINADALSPRVQQILTTQFDPQVETIRQALLAAELLPDLLGISPSDPQTYLILLQNEDELRPTGGFITSVGTVTMRDGQPSAIQFEDSYAVDDYAQLYPGAPWQLERYMRAEILLLRDVNWYSDFPKTAQWARYLYAYTREPRVNGVIAFDQYAFVQILSVIGPVQVQGVAEPISADNVIAYMRKAKSPPPGASLEEWDRKAFIRDLASPLLNRILAGSGFSWQDFSRTVLRLLQEKHILLQVDQPQIATILEKNAWNGQVSVEPGDFIMVVDSNIGFNKTSAVIDQTVEYEVDLAELTAPRARLKVTHFNHARADASCIWAEKNALDLPEEAYYRINSCYWNYMRIYMPTGTFLTGAQVEAVPADWTIDGQPVPPRVDVLDEGIARLQAFGLYLVVPGNDRRESLFQFGLPAGVVSRNADGQWQYRLKIQKQPGLVKSSYQLTFILPPGATLLEKPAGALLEGDRVTYRFDLITDTVILLVFQP